jgi:hypothetical protein
MTIFVESKPDRKLVTFVIRDANVEIEHVSGRSGACKRLMQERGCVGLIDEDPTSNSPGYLKGLVCKEDWPELGILLLRDEERGNEVILLRPRLEEWLVAAVHRNGSEMLMYNLPSDGVELHKIINKNLSRMDALLQYLEGSEEIEHLRKILAVKFVFR